MKAKKVIMYSALERRRYGIMGAETYLGVFLFMFPLVPILSALFSCYVYKLSDALYSRIFMMGTVVLVVLFLLAELRWLGELMTVYMIGDDGCIYRLHISSFWYKIKNCTNLLNPMETHGGKIMQLFYMINNIKIVLETSGDVTFDDLIQMGRLARISDIKEVKQSKKKIILFASIEGNKGIRNGKVVIRKVYDGIDALQEYISIYQNEGENKAKAYDFKRKKNLEAYIPQRRTPLHKLARFLIIWTGIMLWFALFTVYPDLNKLSNINSGRYEKTVAYANKKEKSKSKAVFSYDGKEYTIEVPSGKLESDEERFSISVFFDTERPEKFFLSENYGLMYKPVFVIYLMVIIIYLISGMAQYIIDRIMAEPEDRGL